MDKKTVNLEIINGLKSKGINISEVEKNHLEAFADIMYKAINYSQCCMGETELDEDVSVNIQHKSLGKFKLVKKQDSETEKLANFCKKISKQEDCPAEFQEIVNKEFWNLIG